MLPYHASSKFPSPSPGAEEGGGEKMAFAMEGGDNGGSMGMTRKGNSALLNLILINEGFRLGVGRSKFNTDGMMEF